MCKDLDIDVPKFDITIEPSRDYSEVAYETERDLDDYEVPLELAQCLGQLVIDCVNRDEYEREGEDEEE